MRSFIRTILLAWLLPGVLGAQPKPRGRELGIPFPGKTGPENAITDVAGVAVAHVTLISGEGKVVPGQGPVRTGVTAILTRPRGDWDFVMAATFNQNGNGDMTGVNWIKESGFLEGPILLTGTHSVGTVRDAAIQWEIARGRQFEFTYPIVSETFDSLSDANGQYVRPEHVWAALDGAKGGRVHGGSGRRRDRDDLQRVQGRDRHLVAGRGREEARRPTPSGSWCSATTAAICRFSACRSAARSPASSPASPSRESRRGPG